jgi:hypothetical protein
MFKTINDFTSDKFTATQWEDAEEKAEFGRQFIRFVESDFVLKEFHNQFYRRLSHTFGHIAHYGFQGFYEEFFENTEGKLRFLKQVVDHPCYGDPTYTYCDVERALQTWLRENGVVAKYEERLSANRSKRMTQVEWDAHPSAYKGFIGEMPHCLALDQKTGATTVVPVEITDRTLSREENPVPLPKVTTSKDQNSSPEIQSSHLEALSAVLDYLWEDERQDFEGNPTPEHIFRKLVLLRELCGHSREREQGGKNEERAQRFAGVLPYYPDTDEYTNATDLLADCMHWCQREGVTFEELLRVARSHFTAELAEEQENNQEITR